MEALLQKYTLPEDNIDHSATIRDDFIEKIARQIPPNSNVIDVGSGFKPYESLFSNCLYTSHEFSENKNIVDKFRGENVETKHKHDIYSDILSIPVPDNTFDFVLCTEVFEHCPEPIRAMKELVRICKPNGKILITAPFTSGIHQEPYHFYSGFSPYFYDYLRKLYNLKIVKFVNQGNLFLLNHQESRRWLKYGTYDILNNSELKNAFMSILNFVSSYALHQYEQFKNILEEYNTPDNMLKTYKDINKFSMGYCVLFQKE